MHSVSLRRQSEQTMILFDMRMHDGSRHFTDAPEIVSWACLRNHLAALPGAAITGYVTDHVTEVWIDFTFRGFRFSVNNQHGNYWFFAEDPETPEFTLLRILARCEPLFERPGGGVGPRVPSSK